MDTDDDYSVDLEIGETPNYLKKAYVEHFCYSCINFLRGDTLGREIKRIVFKLGIVQLTLGGLLLFVTIYEHFSNLSYFLHVNYGASIVVYQYIVAAVGLLCGFFSIVAMRYWASLCTNRVLLGNLLRIYQSLMVLLFFVALVSIVVIFITFKGTPMTVRYIFFISELLFYFKVLKIFPFVPSERKS